MTDLNQETTEEIVIEEKDETNENEDVENKNEIKQIEEKPIKNLTEDERLIIIQNYKNGIDNENYDVKTMKNGGTRIMKKKKPKQNLSQKFINNEKVNERVNDKVYLSDNQLLMEHIFELNNRLNKLQNKQKKLKKKYHKIKTDLYEDVNEVVEQKQVEECQQAGLSSKSENEQKTDEPIIKQPIVQRGWRARVSYL